MTQSLFTDGSTDVCSPEQIEQFMQVVKESELLTPNMELTNCFPHTRYMQTHVMVKITISNNAQPLELMLRVWPNQSLDAQMREVSRMFSMFNAGFNAGIIKGESEVVNRATQTFKSMLEGKVSW